MTVSLIFANNASSRLYAAIDAVTTSIRVEAGDGAKFPQPAAGEHFSVTVEDRRTGQIEIMNCTGRSGDILNVVRHQEGTVAQAFMLGATVSNRLTAGTLTTLANAAGVTEAPADGKQYGRQDEAWSQVTWTTVANKPATFPPTLPIPSSGVTGLDAKQASQDTAITANQTAISDTNTALTLKEDKASKGAASGYAPLDATTKVPAAYLPAYVDDVLEFANLAAFPTPGTAGVIYVALDTNKTYRWGGSSYTEISPSPGSTDAVPEGATNLYFTPARASAAAPVQSVAGRQGNVVLTKSDVGLGNVDNTSDAAKPVSTATQTALNLKADINSPTFTGDPKAPTPATNDNDTSIATTAFVKAQGYLTDAPSDGYTYGRKDAAWAKATGGSGSGIDDYAFSTQSVAPPATGTVRVNRDGANQVSATTMWVHYTNASGVFYKALLLYLLKSGVEIRLQERDNPARWIIYAVNGTVADNTTYCTVPVVWKAVGGGITDGVKITISISSAGGGAGVVISDTAPVGSLPGALWYESDTGNLYIYYADVDSSQWVQVAAPPSPAAQLTAQTRNRIVNGAMQISQEWGNTASASNGIYLADQFYNTALTAAAISAQRVQSTTPNGSKDRFRIAVTTGSASVLANYIAAFSTAIEGNRIADFRWGTAQAKQAILRFGWKSPAGTYSVSVQNGGQTRSYVVSFTIAAGQANTDTEQIFIIPGDTTGTWPTDTSAGARIFVATVVGMDRQGAAGWQAGEKTGTSANSNGFATSGNTFELFDVGLYLDPQNTGVAPPWTMPDEAEELRACQRYYRRLAGGSATYFFYAFADSTTTARVSVPTHSVVQMRATPAISFSAPADFTIFAGATNTPALSALTVNVGGVDSYVFLATTSGLVVGQAGYLRGNTATAAVAINARM